MAHYHIIFLIQIALIYSVKCLYNNQVPVVLVPADEKVLKPTLINDVSFIVQWNKDDIDTTGNFTVKIPEVNCEVPFECNVPVCTFDSFDYDDCAIEYNVNPCDKITVIVKGDKTEEISFNLAPAIDDIVPQLSLTLNKATISWELPESTNDNQSCATRARVALQVGNDWKNDTAKDVSLSDNNSCTLTLDYCQHGNLKAYVIYLSKTGDYDTVKEFTATGNPNFKGFGVTTVTTNSSQENCGLDVSWGVFCTGAHHYTVTCAGKSTEVNDMNATINGLNATSYVVAVQAFWSEKEEMGEEVSINSVKVPAVAPDAPTLTGVDGSDDTPKNLTVSWDPPTTPSCAGDIIGYTITYRGAGDTDNPPVDVGADQTSQDLTDLKPCTDYTVSVVADWSGVTGDAGTNTSTTGSQAPGTPTVTVESVDTATIDLSWKENATDSCLITGYTVNWTSSDGGGLVDVGLDTNYTITGLTCNKDYTVSVTAHAEDGKDSIPFSNGTKTDDQAPEKAPDTKVNEVSNDPRRLDVTWSAVAYQCSGNLTGYLVTWEVGGEILSNTTDSSTTSYTITDLEPCTDYTVNVAAISQTGISGPNATVTHSTGLDVQNIRDIARNDFTPYSLKVNWTQPSDNPCPITKYIVKWANTSYHAQHVCNASETSYNITGLAACTDYDITVIAHTEKGDGKPKNEAMSTGTDAPPVDEVNITPESRNANVTWKKPDTRCKLTYVVEYNGTTKWTYNQATDLGGTQSITDPKVTAYLDNLLPYTDYTVCVSVVDGVNGETRCNISATEPEVPSAPKDVIVNDSLVNDVSLTLMWQYPEEENGIIENYVVYWSLGSGRFTNFTVDANVTSYRITGLSEGTYNFTVSVNNSVGFSDLSEPVYRWMQGANPCDGGCIAGIVVGVLLVMALVVTGVIFRDRIRNQFSTKSPLIEESPYELKGAAILKIDFKRHIEDMELDGATAAYQMLNDQSPQKNKFAASKPFNKGKNRYANIHPFDDTRVKLQLVSNGPKGSDYINANHVTFPDTSPLQFIASQGPVDNTISDFWRMVWEHGVYDIVMLCNLVEKGKTKCAQYWTDSGEKAIEFGEFKIYCHTEEEDVRNQCITRYIDIVKNDQRRIVKQHHYFAWPDFGVPDNEDDMLKFLASVKGNSNSHAKNILVHCSAGVGRTGTFIGLWVLTSILDENKYAKSIDVHKIALMMRECRSDMVQTKAQYLYLHKCLLKYMENMENQAPVSNEDQEDPIYGNVGIVNMGYQ